MGRQLASFDGITYIYNEDGIRTSKTADGITTKYYLDGTRPIEQSNGTDTLHFNYDRNGEAIGFTHYHLSTGYDDPTMCEYIYVKNAQGDVVGIYNSLGDLKVSYTYDPWDKLLSVESDFDQYERTFHCSAHSVIVDIIMTMKQDCTISKAVTMTRKPADSLMRMMWIISAQPERSFLTMPLRIVRMMW